MSGISAMFDPPGLAFSITAGTAAPAIGYSSPGAYGSVTPASPMLRGAFPLTFISDDGGGNFFIRFQNAGITADMFSALFINGIEYSAAAATFAGGGGVGTWTWVGAAGLVNTNVYPVVIL